jgi:hypothetical protein
MARSTRAGYPLDGAAHPGIGASVRRLILVLVAALALGLAVPAWASAIRVVITEGPGRGVVLEVNEQDSTVNDPELGAVGFIAPKVVPDCDSIHYHGTLFGKPDPAPSNCGWGKVSAVQAQEGHKEGDQDQAQAAQEAAQARKRAHREQVGM